MTQKLTDRLSRLEERATPPAAGKHLVFRVEAPRGTLTAEIVSHLRALGHAIRDDDDVLVMNLGTYTLGVSDHIRDLSADVLTEPTRADAPAAGKWPRALGKFTFNLDSPRVLQ